MPSRPVDPERPRPNEPGTNAFDQPTGYSGQGYTAGREIAEGAAAADTAFSVTADARDLPPDNGRRASVDPVTGEVHGSGAGAGGGNPGEDLGEYSPSGDMYPITGGEGTDHTPGSLGPSGSEETHYL